MAKAAKKAVKTYRGLVYKLTVSFFLTSVIPLLACCYLIITYAFPGWPHIFWIGLTFIISFIIACLGFIVARKVVAPVIDMASETKMIAGGDYERKITVDTEDEIGELGSAINKMTKQIKDHMDELRKYSRMTKDVNLEIQRKVVALSDLLQIGDMIASPEKLDEVLKLIHQTRRW